MARNILILYYLSSANLRPTQLEMLYAFRHYAESNCYYLNLYTWDVPSLLSRVDFDLIVFGTSFLDRRRSGTSAWEDIVGKAQIVKEWSGVRIALPQDECNHTDRLCSFIDEFAVDVVFSVAQPSQWPVIYAGVDLSRTRFDRILTGYLDTDSLRRIETIQRAAGERTIDIGYRAAYRPQWGRFGLYKVDLARTFTAQAEVNGLVADISTDSNDFFLGDDWYHFLSKCKYIPGVESGGSLLDRDGSITKKVQQYAEGHPTASFEEVEQQCFPGLDNSVDLRALGPRHLEACATRTCQILIEGEYNDVLLPWSHYIPLKPDFSNIEDVIHVVKEDKMRDMIVEFAYRDIVASGKYTYASYVGYILERTVNDLPNVRRTTTLTIVGQLAHAWIVFLEGLSWVILRAKDLALRVSPSELIKVVRRIKNRNFRE